MPLFFYCHCSSHLHFSLPFIFHFNFFITFLLRPFLLINNMSTTFPLPTECLHIIIRHLADGSDINTLSNLLRVNKYVLSVTLPIMYEHPFRRLPARYVGNPIGFGPNKGDDGEALVRPIMMVRTLLLSLPHDHVIGSHPGLV